MRTGSGWWSATAICRSGSDSSLSATGPSSGPGALYQCDSAQVYASGSQRRCLIRIHKSKVRHNRNELLCIPHGAISRPLFSFWGECYFTSRLRTNVECTLLLGNGFGLWQKRESCTARISITRRLRTLKSLQPKNRAETRYAQLEHLREELRNARKRGVSVNALSAELKAARITISSAALAKYLSRRSSNSGERAPGAGKPHGHVKTGTKEPEHRESGTGPVSNLTCCGGSTSFVAAQVMTHWR